MVRLARYLVPTIFIRVVDCVILYQGTCCMDGLAVKNCCSCTLIAAWPTKAFYRTRKPGVLRLQWGSSSMAGVCQSNVTTALLGGAALLDPGYECNSPVASTDFDRLISGYCPIHRQPISVLRYSQTALWGHPYSVYLALKQGYGWGVTLRARASDL